MNMINQRDQQKTKYQREKSPESEGERTEKKERSHSRQRSRNKQKWTEESYDRFLLTAKKGTFKRLDKFVTLSTSIRHQCNNCHRIWKPSPKKCLPDDYFCPSCALHHRNNILRFQEPKFSWTAQIPNTFYLYKIVDAKTKSQFYKYGRTQHQQSDQRYSSSERKIYEMSLEYSIRGALKNMTAIENLWKRLANENGLKPEFSNKQFHGATQCIVMSEQLLKEMKEVSSEMGRLDHASYVDYNFETLAKERQTKILELISAFKLKSG